MKKQSRNFFGANGVFMTGGGMGGEISGTAEVMLAGLLGGLTGLVCGMVIGVCARFVTLNRVKGIIGGMHWGAYGAGAGALALAMFELLD